MNPSRPTLALKALRELGPKQLGLYTLYRLRLRSGDLRRRTPPGGRGLPKGWQPAGLPGDLLPTPDRETLRGTLGPSGQAALFEEAAEIAAGRARLFGGPPVALQFAPPVPLQHWTAYESGPDLAGQDIKWTWEAGRFAWACTLGRAYLLSGEEHFAQAFWQWAETFWQANPPNLGPQWASAQEVALRLIALTFAGQAFSHSAHSTPNRLRQLARSLSEHAARIPPSLAYARAQNNNHLLSEAAGLYTAGLALPDHPQAASWRLSGWHLFHSGLHSQIGEDGEYVQHSTNYHRLMLHLALWMNCLASRKGQPFPAESMDKLARAVRWLLSLLDAESGQVPNLGPNDGANILPLSALPFNDYRAVLQAAGAAFLGEATLEPGPWDELALWLVPESGARRASQPAPAPACSAPHVLRAVRGRSWVYLRAAHFTSRPGHADQLHLDLWWEGHNLAQDAGTYLYNAGPPWDNALTRSSMHNTLTVNGQDQMARAGRFLYLDWAQAVIEYAESGPHGACRKITARHDGYRRLGVIHQRHVLALASGWLVCDRLLPETKRAAPQVEACLHWLLPDWPWELAGSTLRLRSPGGWIELQISRTGSQGETPGEGLALQLVRAGECLHGDGPVSPTWGWIAPTYGYKTPALSLRATASGKPPLELESRWILPVSG